MTLEEVTAAFTKWRIARASTKESIPLDLWEKVKELVPNYKKSVICKALHLSGGQFNKHCFQANRDSKPTSKNDGFVQAIAATLRQTDICELNLQGKSKTLTLKVPLSQLSFVLPLMENLI